MFDDALDRLSHTMWEHLDSDDRGPLRASKKGRRALRYCTAESPQLPGPLYFAKESPVKHDSREMKDYTL